MSEIEIHEYSDKEISDAMVIVSFPTVGLISTIVANFLVSNLELERVAAMTSKQFYPAAIIQDGTPVPPVRIYAGDHMCGQDNECKQIVVVTSELPVKPDAYPDLVDKIFEWAGSKNSKLIIPIEGINVNNQKSGDDDEDEDSPVYHVCSNEQASDFFNGLDSDKLSSGMVSGLSGLLLYKGNLQDHAVSCLLAEAHSQYPDSRSAARVLKVLDKMVPQIQMDPEPLLQQAEMIEEQVKKAMEQIKPMQRTELPEAPPTGMYG